MKFLQSALFGLLVTDVAIAFTVPPRNNNGASTVVVGPSRSSSFIATRQLQVALSDPNVAADAEQEEAAEEESEMPQMELDPVTASEEDVDDAPASDLFAPLPEEKEHKIFVGNLPFSATVEKVRELFETSNIPVLSVSLPTNPNRINEETGMPFSKGFAFVTVETEELVEQGVEAMMGQEVDGRPLRANKLLPKEELEKLPKKKKGGVMEGRKKLYIGNLSFDASYDDVKDLFVEYGDIHDLYLPQRDGRPRGFAFITMDEENAKMAMSEINGMEFMGRSLAVNEPMGKSEKAALPKRASQLKVYVGNLSFSTTRDTLQGVFEEFGDVYDCYLPLDPNTLNPRGFAFVTMNRENGEDAIAELDGLELDGRFIRVNEAQGKRKPAPTYNSDDDDDWYNDNGAGNDESF